LGPVSDKRELQSLRLSDHGVFLQFGLYSGVSVKCRTPVTPIELPKVQAGFKIMFLLVEISFVH
jgi:hypothetical protein